MEYGHDSRRLHFPNECATPVQEFWSSSPSEEALNPVFTRILRLAKVGLDAEMVMYDYLRKCIAPLHRRSSPACLYTDSEDVSRYR